MVITINKRLGDLEIKGLRKNNFAELTPRFRSDLTARIEQSHRNSITISRTLRLRRRQRWPGDGMRKCEVIFAQALSFLSVKFCLLYVNRRSEAIPQIVNIQSSVFNLVPVYPG